MQCTATQHGKGGKSVKKLGEERNLRLKVKKKKRKNPNNQPPKIIVQNLVWLLWLVFLFHVSMKGEGTASQHYQNQGIGQIFPKYSERLKKKMANLVHGAGEQCWERGRVKKREKTGKKW